MSRKSAKGYAIFIEKRGAPKMLRIAQETKSCAPVISHKKLFLEKLLVCIVCYPYTTLSSRYVSINHNTSCIKSMFIKFRTVKL